MGSGDRQTETRLTVGEWHVWPDRLELRNDTEVRKLEPMTMRLLELLAHNGTRTTTRDEIVDGLWDGRAVTDDAINKQLSKLRSALGDGYLQTVPRVGVRLTAAVSRAEDRKIQEMAARRRRPQYGVLLAATTLVLGLVGWLLARPTQWELVQDPVTTIPGTEIEPALSPDGQWLAYVAAEQPGRVYGLYVRATGGEQSRRITPAGIQARVPSWSDDGRVAFVMRSGGQCHIAIALPSGSFRPVSRCVLAEIGGLAWLDEHRLIVSDHARAGESFRLEVLDIGTGQRSLLVTPPVGDAGDLKPLVSADRRTVYFLRNKSVGASEVYSASLADRSARPVSGDGAAINGLALGPAGSLLISSQRSGHGFSLWQLDPANRDWRRLMPEGAPGIATSRDGQFATYSRLERQISLWQLPLDGGDGRALAASTKVDWSPIASPDGQRLAFLSNRTGQWEVWLLELDTLRANRLTRFGGPEVQDLSWSRDGRMIATSVASGGLFDIHLVDVASRASRKVAVTPRDERQPAFAPDGRSLWFVRRSGSRFELRSLDLASQAESPLLDGVMRASPSPNGRFAYYTKPFIDGLWRADLQTKSIERVAAWPDTGRMRNVDAREDGVWTTALQPDRSIALMRMVNGRPPILIRRLPGIARPSGITLVGDSVIYARLLREEADLVTLRLEKRR